ncbi:MAG: CoA-binding protein [Candidatus Omnitrophica bacterium]|nr:CoA-binding protein [Candidatus Omnitrophota bacterium]
MKDIRKKKIVVVGVSDKEEKYGFKIFKSLIEAGFNISGVNPKNGEILGRKIHRTLEEIQPVPDLVITVVPPSVTEKIVQDCKEIGIKEIWMQPGSESEAAVKKAGEYGITVTYNACFMVQHGIW